MSGAIGGRDDLYCWLVSCWNYGHPKGACGHGVKTNKGEMKCQ